MKAKNKNFRKRSLDEVEEKAPTNNDLDEEQERRLALEEIKFLQKQRDKKSGIPAILTANQGAASGGAGATNGGGGGGSGGLVSKVSDKNEVDGENDELVLQDTFAQETAVMVEDRDGSRLGLTWASAPAADGSHGSNRRHSRRFRRADGRRQTADGAARSSVLPLIPVPLFCKSRLRYVEQELAKRRGKNIDVANQVENEIKHAEDELYKIPEHLKVKRRNSEESSTQWTTGIAEIQLPIEYKLRNIEETEAAKKLLQEKRLMGRTKTDSSIPSSYSADYFQRGKDYAEKLRREHPELYKHRGAEKNGLEPRPNDSNPDAAGRRQAATDEFMLQRFRKRERHRVRR